MPIWWEIRKFSRKIEPANQNTVNLVKKTAFLVLKTKNEFPNI